MSTPEPMSEEMLLEIEELTSNQASIGVYEARKLCTEIRRLRGEQDCGEPLAAKCIRAEAHCQKHAQWIASNSVVAGKMATLKQERTELLEALEPLIELVEWNLVWGVRKKTNEELANSLRKAADAVAKARMSDRTFEYKLNAMEIASGCPDPSEHGYKEKHQAVIDFVADLERKLAVYEEESAALPEDRSIREVVQAMQEAQARVEELRIKLMAETHINNEAIAAAEKAESRVEAMKRALERSRQRFKTIDDLTDILIAEAGMVDCAEALAATGKERGETAINTEETPESAARRFAGQVVEWESLWRKARPLLEYLQLCAKDAEVPYRMGDDRNQQKELAALLPDKTPHPGRQETS